ncbi:hypothetical protein N9165_00355 [Akkermansiaceae bacterium]|nr:hypothetical protein [Akkermansiaceae bacterium]
MNKILQIVVMLLIFLAATFIENSEAQMSEAQANHCWFKPITVDVTTIKQAECTLSQKGFKLVSSVSFEEVQIDSYQYRSARFERTLLVFRNGMLTSISTSALM